MTFEEIAREMEGSPATLRSLYKRAKDQMTQRFADGSYSRAAREADDLVLTPAIRDLLRPLLGRVPRGHRLPGTQRRLA